MLQDIPKKRYGSAAEVLAALNNPKVQKTVVIPPPQPIFEVGYLGLFDFGFGKLNGYDVSIIFNKIDNSGIVKGLFVRIRMSRI
ncbi:hypothetical protein ACOWPH_22560 [Anabaena sp. PCC 7938]|uniref:hypothetical protein n=1 Tax=Anabaena TaxID=1163 RepID=UPI000306F1B1|nr:MULTISPECIES: hypothetical protein [Anabaena]MCM2406045.1 hypothetical protein [Anabaena sp. CCAP 1446/1C]BAY01887.1 hypothetical protein NIES19_11230 [Anabaena cylindrica PCC 7122]